MSTRHDPGRPIDWPPMAELRRLYDLHGSWPKVARVLGVANGDADASHEVGQGMEDRDMRPRGLDMECG